MIQRLVEVAPKVQLDERGGEMIDGVTEVSSKGEMRESRWKEINRMVEIAIEVQFFEVGWEVVYRLVEVRPKRETGEGVRESIEDCMAEEVGELRGQGMWSVASHEGGIDGEI